MIFVAPYLELEPRAQRIGQWVGEVEALCPQQNFPHHSDAAVVVRVSPKVSQFPSLLCLLAYPIICGRSEFPLQFQPSILIKLK